MARAQLLLLACRLRPKKKVHTRRRFKKTDVTIQFCPSAGMHLFIKNNPNVLLLPHQPQCLPVGTGFYLQQVQARRQVV